MVADVRARGKIAQFHHSGRRGICSRSFLPEWDLLEETEKEREREEEGGGGEGERERERERERLEKENKSGWNVNDSFRKSIRISIRISINIY